MRLGTSLLVVLGLAAACTQPTVQTLDDTTSSVDGDDPAATDDSGPSASTQSSGVALGVAVPGSEIQEVIAIEDVIGKRFDLVRLFARWDDPTPNPDLQSMVDAGYQVHFSIRPRTNQGQPVLWADLATAEPGTATYGQLINWIDQLAALPVGSYATLNHEPETSDSAANGDAEDFINMWRRFAQLLDERGGDHVQLVWTMTGGSFRSGRAAEWYPGDDVVDVVGADLYNWHTCQGTQREWRSLEVLIEEPLAFAREKGKPLAIPEVASVEDPAVEGRKAEWLNDTAALLAKDDINEDLLYLAWFDVTAPGGVFPDCVWDYDSSPSSAEAFARLVAAVTD